MEGHKLSEDDLLLLPHLVDASGQEMRMDLNLEDHQLMI
jgi:hypothetical protein